MTHREKRCLFTRNVAKLIAWAFEHGYEVAGNEWLRTKDQQAIYVKSGASKTMNSKHLVGLAIDLNLYIGGVYQQSTAAHAPLGAFWKSLHPANVWGGEWGFDGNHYEMT